MSRLRWKVACVNWGNPDAPHCLVYAVSSEGEMATGTWYRATWSEGIDLANRMARLTAAHARPRMNTSP